MRYKYRIKIRHYHKHCTRYLVQMRFCLIWFTPKYVARELNNSDDIEQALQLIRSEETCILEDELNNLERKMYKKMSKIIK